MVGTTLVDIRQHIEDLASEDADYFLVCARTGDRPVPAESLWFENRATARAAARATEQYRAALRRYDPRLPYYDLVVCQDAQSPREREGTAPASEWSLSDSVGGSATAAPERRELVEFCHRVAAAVFETLSDGTYDGVESAIMDAYFAHAESVADPDELCLRLLESVATELDERLSPRAQADVLARAAGKLSRPEPSARPVDATLATLRERRMLGEYTCASVSIDLRGTRRTVVGVISDYALSPCNGRLPVLPLVVELFRHRPDWPPSKLRAAAVEDGWRVTLELADDAEPDGLASAAIQTE